MLLDVKGILKLILVIFCISWKLAIDIYETLTRFLSMKLCKSDIIRWYIFLELIITIITKLYQIKY
jgi:hypothetical protein